MGLNLHKGVCIDVYMTFFFILYDVTQREGSAVAQW